MSIKDGIRIDKWLWAVRIFKTRSISTEECRKGRVLIEGMPVKPSRTIHGDEIIVVKKPPVIYTYKVKGLTENRVGAKLVPEFLEDLTSSGEIEKLDIFRLAGYEKRDRGTGRPTKKERRLIDKFKDKD